MMFSYDSSKKYVMALAKIESILKNSFQSTEEILNEVVKEVGETLDVDRCFLCVRDPSKERCRTPFVWRRDHSIPGDYFQMKWVEESSFINDDPLYRAALACQPSIYISDIEQVSSEILNREFEDRYFGHRAFIHAHLVKDGILWGTLEPAVFNHPRQWTSNQRTFIETLSPLLAEQIQKFIENQ